MTDIQDLREIVNPVFNTAKSCLQIDAAAGDEDSKQLLDVLGFESFGSKSSKKTVSDEMHEKVKRVFPAYAALVETRFQSMNRLIESRNERQIADLPCGYTARGIKLSHWGRTYYGFDLPAVTEVVAPAVKDIIGDDKNIKYQAADATNYASLEAAFDDTTHDLMFTTEGLLTYFKQYELEEVFSNIHRLLLKYGGSWVIADRAYFLHDQEIASAALNNDPELSSMYRMVTERSASEAADTKVRNNIFYEDDKDKVRTFINGMGFGLKEICMADYLPEKLGATGGDQAAEKAVRDVFKRMFLWELTVSDARKEIASDTNSLSLVKSVKEDGILSMTIQGRMDTITAPELLKQFKDAGDIEAIKVDVSGMAYVSSAGLRVLMMMYKSLKDKNRFEMTGISDNVRKILETTGLDQFLL